MKSVMEKKGKKNLMRGTFFSKFDPVSKVNRTTLKAENDRFGVSLEGLSSPVFESHI